MLKFKVTNVSDLPKFLIEAGRLLKPGQSIAVNRLDAATKADPAYKVEDAGGYAAPSPVAKIAAAPAPDDDEDDDRAARAKATAPEDTGPARLVDNKVTKRSVPLQAVATAAVDDPDDAPEAEVQSAGGEDELAGLIPAAAKADITESGGFRTHKGIVAGRELGR